MMLYEMIMERIPDATPIMQNTDGVETIIPRGYEEKYMEICKEWEDITSLVLEHDTYSKIILADVNNYIAVHDYKEVDQKAYKYFKEVIPHDLFKIENGKYYYGATKCKGMRFEFHDLALHKNKSFLITRKALFHYFVHGTDPEQFMKTQTNIYDFCGGVKIKGDWEFKQEYIKKGEHIIEDLQDTIRYYISNKGSKIVKCNKLDGRRNQIEAGKWLQTPFINYDKKPMVEYDLDYKYYLNKINKVRNSVEPFINQLKLL